MKGEMEMDNKRQERNERKSYNEGDEMTKVYQYIKYIEQEFNKIEELLKQLKIYAKFVRDVEYEHAEASGIEFAVEVIEKGKFPEWVTEGEITEEIK